MNEDLETAGQGQLQADWKFELKQPDINQNKHIFHAHI